MNKKDRLIILAGIVDIINHIHREEITFLDAMDSGLKLLDLFETQIRQDQKEKCCKILDDYSNQNRH